MTTLILRKLRLSLALGLCAGPSPLLAAHGDDQPGTEVRSEQIVLVSKSDHLDWALPIFRQSGVFKSIEPLACVTSKSQSIRQMEEYLKLRPSARVTERLAYLVRGVKGTD